MRRKFSDLKQTRHDDNWGPARKRKPWSRFSHRGNEKISSDETSQVKDDNDKEVLSKWTEEWKKNDIQNARQITPRQQRQQCGECPVVFYFLWLWKEHRPEHFYYWYQFFFEMRFAFLANFQLSAGRSQNLFRLSSMSI